MRVLSVCLAAALLVLGAAGSAAAQTRPLTTRPSAAPDDITYSVIYTGRFFGFFRHPGEQSDSLRTCSDVKDAPSGPARAFLDELKTLAGGGLQVRVAVGDNFAPFILARELKIDGEFVQKDLVVYDDAQAKWVKNSEVGDELMGRLVERRVKLTFDNVACFMRLAQLDAVVPGKHDFYYGGERLRALAGLLAANADGPFEPVQMLGANLSLATTDTARTPVPDRDVHHDLYVDNPKSLHGAKPILPKVPLPWLRRIRIENAFRVNSVFDAGGRLAGYDLDELLDRATFRADELQKLARLNDAPVDILDTEGRRYVVAPNVGAVLICPAGENPSQIMMPVSPKDLGRCRRLEPGAAEEPGRFHLQWPFHIPRATGAEPADDTRDEFALAPNTNQAVCLYESADLSGKPYCVPFRVHAPFFEDPTSAASASGECAAPKTGRILPYVLKTGPNGKCVAVFGVVDPSLREYVGALNYTWLNKTLEGGRIVSHPERHTELEVSDPVEALTQLIQYCDADTACAGARKILLAHMPRSKASEVAARFATGTFDLVIAQSDIDRASGNLTIERTIVLGPDGANAIAEPTVLVPGQHITLTDPDVVRARLERFRRCREEALLITRIDVRDRKPTVSQLLLFDLRYRRFVGSLDVVDVTQRQQPVGGRRKTLRERHVGGRQCGFGHEMARQVPALAARRRTVKMFAAQIARIADRLVIPVVLTHHEPHGRIPAFVTGVRRGDEFRVEALGELVEKAGIGRDRRDVDVAAREFRDDQLARAVVDDGLHVEALRCEVAFVDGHQ